MTPSGALGQELLDLVFDSVGKLAAAPAEELDPVVRRRVVAGRQDHPEIGVEGLGQVGHGGGGNHAEPQHVHPGTGQSGDNGRFQELTRSTRIPAHDGTRPAAAVGRIGTPLHSQHVRRGNGHIEGQPRRQITASDPPNAVSTEETAHDVTLPLAIYPSDTYEDARRPHPEYQNIRERALGAPG